MRTIAGGLLVFLLLAVSCSSSEAPSATPTPGRNCHPANLNDERLPIAVGFSYLDATHLWALSMNGERAGDVDCVVVEFSSDGGKTWAKLSAPDITTKFGTNITFANANDGWLWGPAQYETHDGGRTWALTQRGQVLGMWPAGDSVWMLEAASCRPPSSEMGTAPAKPATTAPIAPCPPQLWASSDAGRTWSPLALPAIRAEVQVHLSRPSATDAWLAAQDDSQPTLFVTHDGARSWREVTPPDSPGHVADIAALDGNHAWLATAGSPATIMLAKQIYATADGGASWKLIADAGVPERGVFQNLPVDGNTLHLAAPAPGHLFLAMARNTLYGSFDGGAMWAPVINDPNFPIGADSIRPPVFADASHGVTNSMSSIYITSDGGANWTALRLAR